MDVRFTVLSSRYPGFLFLEIQGLFFIFIFILFFSGVLLKFFRRNLCIYSFILSKHTLATQHYLLLPLQKRIDYI